MLEQVWDTRKIASGLSRSYLRISSLDGAEHVPPISRHTVSPRNNHCQALFSQVGLGYELKLEEENISP